MENIKPSYEEAREKALDVTSDISKRLKNNVYI